MTKFYYEGVEERGGVGKKKVEEDKFSKVCVYGHHN